MTGNAFILANYGTTLLTVDSAGFATFANGVKAVQFIVNGAAGGLNTAPSTPTSAGTTGEIRFCADGIYICTATNTWIKCVGTGSF